MLYQIDYTWNLDNTLQGRWITDNTTDGLFVADAFTYDNRKRLRAESRTDERTKSILYSFSYDYDQLGNRLVKHDSVADSWALYSYDTDYRDPNDLDYPTRNNRLLQYKLYAGDPNDPNNPRRTVSYTYYETGDVSNITIKDKYVDSSKTPGDPNDYAWHYDLALYPFQNGGVNVAAWGRYQTDPNGVPYTSSYEFLGVRQFGFDQPRQRWLARELQPLFDGEQDPPQFLGFAYYPTPDDLARQDWTDYHGDVPWADTRMVYDDEGEWPVDHPATARRYLGRFAPNSVYDDAPGQWPVGLDSGSGAQPLVPVLAGEQNMDPNDPNLVLPGAAGTRYYHMDLTGSVIMTTGPDGTGGEGDVSPVSLSYTAFGELVVWDPDAGDGGAWIIGGPLGDGSAGAPAGYPRYQYCGTWGYETGRDAIEAAGGRAADPELLALAGANPTLPKIKLMHVGARWYDPAIGRFVQRDPMGISGGKNVYTYTANNPLGYVDPTGLWSYGEVISTTAINAALGALGGGLAAAAHPCGATFGGIVGGALVGAVQGGAGTFGIAWGAAAGAGAGFVVSAWNGDGWAQIGVSTIFGGLGGALGGIGANDDFTAVIYEVFFYSLDAGLVGNLFHYGFSK